MPAAVGAQDVLHDRTRLSIVALLAGEGGAPMTFTDVQRKLDLTAGNLSSHLRVLEQQGLVIVEKHFEGRRPQTTLQLDYVGRAALQQFIEDMEHIIQCLKDQTQ